MKYDRDKEWTRPDWVQRASTLAEQVSAACDSSKTLIASAEHEFQELKESLAEAANAKLALHSASPREPRVPPTAAAFGAKLRIPGGHKDPGWWAVLGLNQ